MDDTEAIVEQYLRSIGYSDIAYEPDGNVPPDFLVNGHIAVEARRLNQHETGSQRSRGLEEIQIPLLQRMRNLLEAFGPPTQNASWFVTFRFSRPMESWKVLRPKLEHWLSEFRDGPQFGRNDIEIGPNFYLSVVRASSLREKLYLLGGFVDRDSSGWLVPKLESNIQHCIDEKTAKIASVRHRYEEWWLVLVDRIGYGLSKFDREVFRNQVSIRYDWNKLILVNPLDPTSAFEV